MSPQNAVRETGYLTPNDVPEERVCRSFSIPNDARWLGTFMGAIAPLLLEETWRKFGDLDPSDCAAEWQNIFFSFMDACSVEVGTPFWDSATDVDDQAPEAEQIWYGRFVA